MKGVVMKELFGLILIIAGIIVGLYVGVWVMFIGGIVQVIESIRAENLIALDVAIAVARILFAGFFGWLAGILAVIPGVALIQS